MDSLLLDARLAVRRLAATPVFTTVALLVLALGIGATTSVFSVVNGVLLRALPFREPDRLARVFSLDGEDAQPGGVSYPDFADMSARSRSFAGMAATNITSPTLTAPGTEPTRVTAAGATPNLFSLLGAAAARGRTFDADADARRECVVVMSDALWRTRFSASDDILSRSVTLDGTPCRVIGVMPPSFRYPAGAQLWYPLVYPGQESRGVHNLRVVARLARGASVERADAELRAIAAQLAMEHPETNAKVRSLVLPAHEALVGGVRTTLLVLFGAVGLVLLVACANLAGLQLARAAGRTREMAILSALGASRGRLVTPLLVESAILGLAGGVLGAAVAWWTIPLLVRAAPSDIPRLDEIGLDAPVLAFAAAASLLTGLLFGIVPALHGARAGSLAALRDGRRATGGRRGVSARQALVVAELALAVVLVAGAGLLARSFWRTSRVDPGFEPAGLLAVTVQLPNRAYPTAERKALFFDQLLARVRALRGVTSAAVAMGHPLDAGWTSSFAIVGEPPPAPGRSPEENLRVASPAYFRTVGVPLLAGRDFDAREKVGGPGAVIVNEAFARKYFRGGSALGRTLDRGVGWWEGMPARFEIVGVVANERFAGLTEEPRPATYFPYPQFAFDGVQLLVRAPGEPAALAGAVRDAVHALDPAIPVEEVRWMTAVHAAALGGARFNTALLAAFALLALVLAAVGIYGVLAYLVAERTAEIGIRMALGAERGRVVRLVLGQGLALVGAGLALGIAGALGATRALRTLLFEVAPHDAATYAAVAALLTLVALLACWIPARRATRIDPMVALRG